MFTTMFDAGGWTVEVDDPANGSRGVEPVAGLVDAVSGWQDGVQACAGGQAPTARKVDRESGARN
ncbi:hypothetical protein ACIF8W_28280 [Streptomyces sp. NPDC085639]|uniref:hypothetical protein n=1 Tax=Streptomyces sp. NPDC085639 TaxID=3365734 RepID=UPI0037D89E89